MQAADNHTPNTRLTRAKLGAACSRANSGDAPKAATKRAIRAAFELDVFLSLLLCVCVICCVV